MNSKVTMAIRILGGLVLLIFGINKFFTFITMPPPPEAAAQFYGALLNTGYIMPMVALVEIVAGISWITNKYVPFTTLLMAPISVNIVSFHLFLAPGGIALGAVVALINAYLFYIHKDKFMPLMQADA